MKKILLTLAGAICLASSANAQLAEGSVFPFPGGTTGALTAVNGAFSGVRYNLDSLSSAGYTIFIDISATWCPPCWAYHNTHALDSLWVNHGPSGMPGVSATTTNDVFVIFVQGETTSHLAELTGDYAAGAIQYTTTESPQSNVTQGDWTAGNAYPMVDDTTSSDANYGTAAIDAAWQIAFFPTVYMVCRDHLVHNLSQPTATDAYAAAQAGCPNYGPSATINAKAIAYQGSDFYVCNANPSLTFQNYSASTNITAATITVKDASNAVVATQNWTGNLAPYATASVNITSFAGTSFGGYKYSVAVVGDDNAADDVSADSVFKVYAAINAGTLPATEDFESNLSYKESFVSPDGYIAVGAFSGQVGATTGADAVLFRDWYAAPNVVEQYIFGNFNTASTTRVTLQFDVAYAQYSASYSDALAVKTSTDCGTTWTTQWTQSGATLATVLLQVQLEFYPTAASQWKHVTVNMTNASAANTMLEFVNTSANGNDIYVDNVMLANTTAVTQVLTNNDITLAPNPAKDMANVSLTLTESANVQVQVIDAVGRVMITLNNELTSGAHNIEISTADLATGLCNVKITTNGSIIVKPLSVIK